MTSIRLRWLEPWPIRDECSNFAGAYAGHVTRFFYKVTTLLHMTNLQWRFFKNLWLSQIIWTLPQPHKVSHTKRDLIFNEKCNLPKYLTGFHQTLYFLLFLFSYALIFLNFENRRFSFVFPSVGKNLQFSLKTEGFLNIRSYGKASVFF